MCFNASFHISQAHSHLINIDGFEVLHEAFEQHDCKLQVCVDILISMSMIFEVYKKHLQSFIS